MKIDEKYHVEKDGGFYYLLEDGEDVYGTMSLKRMLGIYVQYSLDGFNDDNKPLLESLNRAEQIIKNAKEFYIKHGEGEN